MKKLSFNTKVNLIIAFLLLVLASVPTLLVWLTDSLIVGIAFIVLVAGILIFYLIRVHKRAKKIEPLREEVQYTRSGEDKELEKLALIEQVGTRQEDNVLCLYWLLTFESNGVNIQNVYHTEWTDIQAAQLFHQRFPKGSFINIRCSEENINEIQLPGSSVSIINDGKFLIAQMKGGSVGK